MTFSDLIAEVARDSNLTRADVKKVLLSTIKTVRAALNNGDRNVRLTGFGCFYSVVIAPKMLFGLKVESKKTNVIRFREFRRHDGKVRSGV